MLPFTAQGVSAMTDIYNRTMIKITSGQTVIVANLDDTAASRDLLSKLPVSLEMNIHENREYYTTIHLDESDERQDGYEIGDIAYWAPGNALVLYYGPGYTGNLIKMGQITSGLDKLPGMGKRFMATIEKM